MRGGLHGHAPQAGQRIAQGARADQHLLFKPIVGEVEQQVPLGEPRKTLGHIQVGLFHARIAITPHIAELAADHDQHTRTEEKAEGEGIFNPTHGIGDQPIDDQRNATQQAGETP